MKSLLYDLKLYLTVGRVGCPTPQGFKAYRQMLDLREEIATPGNHTFRQAGR